MSILKKLYTHDSEKAAKDILHTYEKQKYCIVSFLYFANVMHRRVLEKHRSDIQRDYLHALEKSDYLLPDGIALQLFYRWGGKKRDALHNLNGTDFTPFFLNQINRDKLNIILYGGTETVIGRTVDHFTQQGFNVVHHQHGYEKFNRDALDTLNDDKKMINVVLLARGTPRQEIWADEHIEKIRKHKLLVLSVGGLFDFLSGDEHRAPLRMRKARVLETPWRILTNPAKNLRKFVRMFGILRYRTKQILSGK